METKMKHTPGPWAIEYKTEDKFTYTPRIYAGPAVLHYSAGYHTEEQDAKFKARAEANARLIAAAPELLEVAQGILADDMLQYLPAEYVFKVRAAIAKATGHSQEAVSPYICKYCGEPSRIDPSDQSPPLDYCHSIDHGY